MKNREMKFRAWDKWNNRWYDLSENYLHFNESGFINEGNLSDPDDDRFSLSQFTGLCDKNGKEIYEGDVVKTEMDRNKVVEFLGGAFAPFCESAESTTFVDNERCEIIGNIYESEHLKSKEGEEKK